MTAWIIGIQAWYVFAGLAIKYRWFGLSGLLDGDPFMRAYIWLFSPMLAIMAVIVLPIVGLFVLVGKILE